MFLKYILKSMMEKKGRLILLLIAIAMSVGLFVASSGVIDIGIKSSTRPFIESYENKDIIVSGSNDETFFDADNIKEDGIKNLIKEIYLGGSYIDNDSNINITLLGREDEYINESLLLKGSLDGFSGAKCIISQRTSEEKNIKKGDKIELIIAGQNKELEVSAISATNNVFYTDTINSFTVIIPYEYLSKELGVEGKYSVIMADSSKNSLQDSIDAFNDANDNFSARKLFDADEVKEQMSSFTSMLYAMLVIVVVMSAIIIYGSFKLTVTERLPVIGTFLSQGATVGTVEKILLLESVVYGVFGGIIGNLLGIGGLKLINYIISPLKDYGIIEKVDINIETLVFGMIFSIILAVVSALIPVLKVRRLQVKEVILNNVAVSTHIGWGKFIIGIVLLLFSIVVAFANGEEFDELGSIAILTSIIGAVCVYKKVVDILSRGLYKLLKGRSKSLVFSINNLRTSKVLLGNISLMIVALSSIFMITSLGTSIKNMLVGCYEDLKVDINIQHISTIKEDGEPVVKLIEKDLEKIDGIDKSTFCEEYNDYVNIDGQDERITCIDEDSYADYNKYLDFKSDKNIDMFNKFKDKEKSIIVSKNVLEQINKKVGDIVTIELNGKSNDLEIIGTYDGKLFNMGYTMFMKNSTLENEFGMKGRQELVFSTTRNAEDVKNDLKFLTKKYGVNISTKNEIKKIDEENNQMVINVLSIFSYMSIIIAALGILNNIIIGFLQRKRELAVLTSIGMSNGRRNLMLVFESILSVMWSFVITMPLCILIMKLVSRFSNVIKLPLEAKMDFSIVPQYLIGTLIIILIATLPVIFKNRKLSIISELKYE